MLRKSQYVGGKGDQPGSASSKVDGPVVTKLSFDSQQDKVWFNVEIGPNPDFTNTATFIQQFNLPLVDNPEEYYCLVPRFSVPTSVIPVFVPEFQSGSFTNTIYNVSISYNGTTNSEYVIFVPQSGYPTTSELYPYIYNYSDFLNMVNTAIALAFSGLPTPVGSLAPYFQYDAATGLISLVAQRAFYDSALGASAVQLLVNQQLATLLEGIPGILFPFGNPGPPNQDFLFQIYDKKNNWYNPSYLAPATPPDYYIMTQDYPALQIWSPFKSLRLTTTSIPIKKEYIATVGLGGTLSGVGVLQDFIPLYNVTEPRPTLIQYTANQYHLVNMAGNVPLSKLDFQFRWVDGRGIEHPVYIPYNGVCSLEVAFFKKSTFTS